MRHGSRRFRSGSQSAAWRGACFFVFVFVSFLSATINVAPALFLCDVYDTVVMYGWKCGFSVRFWCVCVLGVALRAWGS